MLLFILASECMALENLLSVLCEERERICICSRDFDSHDSREMNKLFSIVFDIERSEREEEEEEEGKEK